MTVLRAAAFNFGFYLWTGFLVVVLLPVFVLPHRVIERAGVIWAGGTLWMLRVLVGLRWEVRGRENLADQNVIYAFKHQSAMETIVFPYLLPHLAAVLKRELMLIPMFGWYLAKYGAVPVNRGRGGSALRGMVRAARAFVDQGRPLIVAPEGTRRAPGAEPRYLPGIAALYTELGLPVVPVAVNTGMFWPRRGFIKRPGCAILQFLDPIPPGLDRRAFLNTLRDRLEAASDALVEEARTRARGGS